MSTNSGYSNKKKDGQPLFTTVHDVGSSKSAQNMINKYLSERTAVGQPIVSSALSQDAKKILIEITGHSARVGDVLRMTSGALIYMELDIIEIVDANFFYVWDTYGALPAPADQGKIMFYVTSKSDAEGNINFQPGPTQFIRDGVSEQVTEDTANANNNLFFPSSLGFYKNGVMTPVNEDTVTPANSQPLPVKLTGVTGDVIINAGDLNVSTDSTNDSMAIGDGVTGNLALVDLNDDGTTYALKVKDDDANIAMAAAIAALQAIDADLLLMSAKLPASLGSKLAASSLSITLASDHAALPLPTGAATSAKQDSQTTELTAIKTSVELIDNSLNLDGTPAGTAGVMIGGKDGSGDFQQVNVNAAGELSVSFGSAAFATETTLAALNAKMNNNYGAATGALRTAAQMGNASGVADFNSGADSAQTLRVSANLKRAGNDLAYNDGAPDANTLRMALATGHGLATAAKQDALLALLPASLGQKTMANSLAITLASDQSTLTTTRASVAGTVTSAQITVGTGAVRATVAGTAPNASRKKLMIKPSKSNLGSIYIGAAGVTTANGMEIIGPDRLEFEFDAGDYYLISDTAAQVVEIVEKV